MVLKGGPQNPGYYALYLSKRPIGRIARVSGCYTGPVQPVVRDSEMSCICVEQKDVAKLITWI